MSGIGGPGIPPTPPTPNPPLSQKIRMYCMLPSVIATVITIRNTAIVTRDKGRASILT